MFSFELNSLFNISECGTLDTMLKIVDSFITDDDSKLAVVKSLSDTLGKSVDSKADNKLNILDAVKSTISDPKVKAKADIATKGLADKSLNNISADSAKTNSPASDYLYITSSLNNNDPSWLKDENGKTNYYRVKGNTRLANGASAMLANKRTRPDTLTNEVSSDFDTTHCVAIVNSVA
jgi:hypothetical protein